LQFYNPISGALVSSIDYKLQPNVTSGAHFGFRYQPGLFLYRLDESTTVYAPKYPLESPVHAHTHSPPSCAKIIGLPSYETPDIYTVVFPDGSVSEYTEDMLSLIPSSNPIPSTSHLPNWIKSGVKATLFLSNMAQPKHGTLHYTPNDCTWTFFPGKQVVTNGILLPDLTANCRELLDTGQLFRGHTKFKNVYNARNQVVLQDCVLRHILAYGFKSLIPPTSPKQHSKLDPNDKAVWDSTYDKEYDGLSSLPTWEVVSEETYHKMSKGAKALPAMALATIKYDSENRPKRAKYRIVYRIVVLGNLDYHNWTKLLLLHQFFPRSSCVFLQLSLCTINAFLRTVI